VNDIWATKSKDVGLLLFVQLVSKIFNLCGPDPSTSQTDRRHAIARPRFAPLCNVVHRAVKTQSPVVLWLQKRFTKYKFKNLQITLKTFLTRKLCYCKDDHAMCFIYECLESFSDSWLRLWILFPNCFDALLFWSTL